MITRFTRARLKRVRVPRKFLLPGLMLCAGLAGGIAIGYALAPTGVDTAVRSAQGAHSTERLPAQHTTDDLKPAYDTSLEMVAADQKTGRLSKEEAQLVQDKLQALYDYKAANPGETREARNAKRQQLRDWARQNKISTRYFVRLY